MSDYRRSLKSQLTRRLMIPFLCWYILLYGLVMLACVRVSTELQTQVNIKRDELSTENYKMMFSSKGMQISDMVQSFLTDIQLQKILYQSLDSGQLVQSPATSKERKWYDNWIQILSNYDKYSSQLEPSMLDPSSLQFKTLRSQYRYSNKTYTFANLSTNVQSSLWLASGADAFQFPIIANNNNFYLSVYAGFSNGLAYFVPGAYNPSAFAPNLPNNAYPTCTVPNHLYGYDPRCRPWYINQQQTPLYSRIAEPYLCSGTDDVCLTITDFIELSNSTAVGAIDLNLGQPWLKQIVTKYLQAADFDKWYLSSLTGLVSLKSQNFESNLQTVPKYLILDSLNYQAQVDKLRLELESKIPPAINITQTIDSTFTQIDNVTGVLSDRKLIQVPIYSVLRDPTQSGAPPNNLTFYLGLTFVSLGDVVITKVLEQDKKYYIIFVFIYLTCFLFAAYFIYQSAHASVDGLRFLNQRFQEIYRSYKRDSTKAIDELRVTEDQRTCAEVNTLIELFQVLITTKNFTINSFLKLPDALAVIDLAEACEIFQQIGNYRATGVCYNNIANYQAKNGKFDLAIQNYDHAIEQVYAVIGFPDAVISSDRKLNVDVAPYFKVVLAHRKYQRAICYYKSQKYSKLIQTQDKTNEKWKKVDEMCYISIIDYMHIIEYIRGRKTLIFIDLIIRLTICRAFANHQSRKLITSGKLLGLARQMLVRVREGSDILVEDSTLRQEASVIPLDILQQKIHFKQGLLLREMNRIDEATSALKSCLDDGKLFDARLRKECIQVLLQIVTDQYLQKKLQKMLGCFKHTLRDFIFLINIQAELGSCIETIKQGIQEVLDDQGGMVQSNDRISLMKFCELSDVRRVFTLVEKHNNFKQLKNQVKDIKCMKPRVPVKHARLGMALKTATGDFVSIAAKTEVTRWIVCFSNSISEENPKVTIKQALKSLSQHKVSLLLFLFGVPKDQVASTKRLVRQLCQKNGVETLLYLDPSVQTIKEAFACIANYKLDVNQPLIMETFT